MWVAAVIAAYLVLNFALNYGNKWLLLLFPFPVFTILAGTLFYAPLSAVLIVISGASFPSRETSRAVVWEVIAIGVVHALGTAAQSYSLSRRHMSVGLNQVIKSCTPAVTLLLSWLLQGVHYHYSLVVATAAVVAGTVLTTVTSSEGHNLNGVAASVASSVFGGLEGVLVDMLLSRHRLSAAQATLLTSVPAVLSLAVLFAVLEWSPSFVQVLASRGIRVLGGLLALSLCAAAYTYFHILLIASTSAHYCNLVGSAKLALIVAISLFVIDRTGSVTVLNATGIALTLSAFCAYSVLRTYFPEKRPVDAKLVAA